MTVKQVEKIVKKELEKNLVGLEFQKDWFFFSFDDKRDIKFFFDTKSIGGEIYINLTVSVNIKHIEDKWIIYLDDLGLQKGLFRASFYNSFNHVDHLRYPTIKPYGIPWEESEGWVKDFVEFIIKDHYLPFTEHLKDIKYCDQIINKDIEITTETCKISPNEGLEFRKIFIAEEAGNPRLEEIKSAMRKYVDEQYILGKKENFERLCMIRPIFEKLFGA
jgi:hypothetical protein